MFGIRDAVAGSLMSWWGKSAFVVFLSFELGTSKIMPSLTKSAYIQGTGSLLSCCQSLDDLEVVNGKIRVRDCDSEQVVKL